MLNSGFSLLELLVVVAIIGLLASYVGPRLFSQIAKSEREVARAQIGSLSKALGAYRIDIGRYPSTTDGLEALMSAPAGLAKWRGPYLQKAIPPDPWNNAYVYVSPGSHGDYDLSSFGADGRSGGSGDDADITSW